MDPREAGQQEVRRGEVLQPFGSKLSELQVAALITLDRVRGLFPPVSLQNVGRGIIAGLIGLTSIACSPSPEPTPIPPPPTQPSSKEIAPRKPGIYVRSFAPQQAEDLVQSYLKNLQVPTTRIINFEAVDPQDPSNVISFDFIEVGDSQSHVIFKQGDSSKGVYLANSIWMSSYGVAAVLDLSSQKVKIGYFSFPARADALPDDFRVRKQYTDQSLLRRQKPFLELVLNESIPKQSGESNAEYSLRASKLLEEDLSYQQRIQKILGDPSRITRVIVNPHEFLYLERKIIFETRRPDLVEELLAILSPRTAYADTMVQGRKTPTPVPQPTPTQAQPRPTVTLVPLRR